MDDLRHDLPKAASDIAKDVAKAVLEAIVRNMPVDTSLAVSNWQVAYDNPNFTNLPPHVPGKGGSTRAASSAETLTVGNIIIQGKRYGVPLHISNGLDYIQDINIQSSMPGFVKKGIDAGQNELAKAKLNL